MYRLPVLFSLLIVLSVWMGPTPMGVAVSFDVDTYSPDALPEAPEGFKVTFFAKEPMIRNSAAIAFDARGRLFAAHGQQFRHPKEDTPGDEILILEDIDGDGVADNRKVFAHGFNNVQGLAWKGSDLWVANAPDLTVVRDTDGDDVADEYRLIYSGIGTLEHGLHGLTWAPDGKLYLSKGDTPSFPEAPKAFRDLAHVPSDYPDTQPIRVFNAPDSEENPYRATYIVPTDPHTEGGILRCDETGENLEVFAKGMRNPYDICIDDEFNWFGTDNDQDEGDRIMMPFYGAHYGHRHPWSYNWTGEDHPPTVPASGPFFHGSGTGVVHYTSKAFPEGYRDVFFIGDWLKMQVYVFRPGWEGALLRTEAEDLEVFAESGEGQSLFRPTDLAVGPNGALYVSGWGAEYGAEYSDDSKDQNNAGRVFKIFPVSPPADFPNPLEDPKRAKTLSEWTLEELVEDLDSDLLVWKVNAQDELVRRGQELRKPIELQLTLDSTSKAQRTWLAWALGRMQPEERSIDRFFLDLLTDDSTVEDLRLQSLRILAHRTRVRGQGGQIPAEAVAYLTDDNPRLRFETVQAIWQTGDGERADSLLQRLSVEEDRIVYYSLWGALRDLLPAGERKTLLTSHESPSVRFGMLLGLLGEGGLEGPEVVEVLQSDDDPRMQKWTAYWMASVGHGLENPSQVIDKLLDLNKRGIDYQLRMNLLAALDRMEVGGEDWTRLHEEFYQGHKRGEIYVPERSQEAALCLRVLSKDPESLPLLWEELTDEWEPVREAAIESFVNLDDEGREFLVHHLEDADPGSVAGAILALSRFHFTTDPWVAGEGQVAMIAGVCLQSKDPLLRQESLRLLLAASPETWENSSSQSEAEDLAKETVLDPDPRISSLAEELGSRVGLQIEAPEREPATLEATLEKIAGGDPENGRLLFVQSGGRAACYQCHRVDGEGRNFAPDLSDAGSRIDPQTLVQSILDPNAVITEGFRAQLVERADGEFLTGVIVAETDSSLQVVQSDGKPLRLDKKDIVDRRTLDSSIMPSNYGTLLTSQEVADIAAWLLSQKGEMKSE